MNELLRTLLNLPAQGSVLAQRVDLLHYFIIGITMAGSGVVGVVVVWFAFRYRRRAEDELTPHVTSPVWLELGVSVSLLALFLAFWVVGFNLYIRMEVPPAGAMEVYVTAKQWMWKFAYPQGQSSIATLYVPQGRPVKLIMTSRDVIHSFYVPAFRQKQDVLPGRYTTTWFEARAPGTFPILCAEYCGTEHSRMLGEVVVLDAAGFAAWLQGEGPPPSVPMVERGLDVATRHGCLACHTLDGQRHIGPSWRDLFGRQEVMQDGRTVLADEDYLTRSMMDPQADVVAGFTPLMPSFQGQLQPAEVGALLELIKSLRAPLRGPVRTAYPTLWKDRAPPAEAPP